MTKIRAEPCEQTIADAIVWATVMFRLGNRGRFGSVLWTRSLMRDRDDANLMLLAQELAQFGNAAISIYGIECRGWSL